MKDFLQKHSIIKDWAYNFTGIVLYAAALNGFLAGNNLVAGGLSGIATALSGVLNMKISVLLLIMNVPLLALALFSKGRAFAANTIAGTFIYTAAVEITSHIPTMTGDLFVATILGGAMYGAGTACLVLGNGSTGGTDIIIRALNKWLPYISVGKMSIFVDGATVLFAVAVYRNVAVGLYAIITLYVSSIVCDKLLLGFDAGNMCIIITERPSHDVSDIIMDTFERSVTEIKGRGMYTDGDKNVLFSVIRPSEAPKLKRLISEIDPNAFLIVVPARDVVGEGFKEFSLLSRLP